MSEHIADAFKYAYPSVRIGKTATQIHNDALRRAYHADMSRVMGPVIQREIDKHIVQAMTLGASALYCDKSGVKQLSYDEMAMIDPKVWKSLESRGDTKVTKKVKEEKFNTIGVRFLESSTPYKVYTYKVRAGKKVHLGQELIADTDRGPAVVVAVRIDKTPQPAGDGAVFVRLKYIEKKAVAL